MIFSRAPAPNAFAKKDKVVQRQEEMDQVGNSSVTDGTCTEKGLEK